ncbi:hypothetical protein BJV82DRAFT_577057 [Fennellomyces sp. T-0311]|nr:hypothetical protein BJV82DRAFT_577057 [Fennellomyces sp. T-0311]
MDLGSLLNQDTSSLSLQSLRDLVKEPESAVKLDKLTNATFTYPSTVQETYEFFNVHIQLLLSIQYTDEAYGSQYTKTVVIESLRTCINGILQHYGLSWLIQFPHHLSNTTWQLLRASTDTTILIYLYGLVLASNPKNNEWASGVVQFIKTQTPVLVCHVWMSCWAIDDDNDGNAKLSFLKELEVVNESDIITQFLRVLDSAQANLLSTQVDQQFASGLWRPAYSEDELLLGHAAFLALAQSLPRNDYPKIASIAQEIQVQRRMKSINFKNPLYTGISEKMLPSDTVVKMEWLRDGIAEWTTLYRKTFANEFNMYLADLVQRYYPNDRKTMLDVILAYWTIRDPCNEHRSIIIDAILTLLKEKAPYNRRSAPYYAFTQLYSAPTNDFTRQLSASAKTGADIDTSQFTNNVAIALKKGCFLTLQKLTPHTEVTKGWITDCLQEAMPEIVEWYSESIATMLTRSGDPLIGKRLCQILKSQRIASLGSYVVPTLLQALDTKSLVWLRTNSNDFGDIVQQYFSEKAPLTRQLLLTNLLREKPKGYMDQLLAMLRETRSTDRAWFLNHFLSALLNVAGDGTESVASQIFRQVLKTRADFIWCFGAAPLDNSNFKGLDISKGHEILAIKQIGLVSMFHEMVRLGDVTKTARLVQMWYTLWTGENSSFTVPVSWIMQCTGLYDEAPAVVKQMIERLIRIGIRQGINKHQEGDAIVPGFSQSSTSFVTSIVDLMVLADVPELDTVTDVFLRLYQEESPDGAMDDEIVWSVVEILVQIVEELKLEMETTRPDKKQQRQKSKGKVFKQGKKKRKNQRQLSKFQKKAGRMAADITNGGDPMDIDQEQSSKIKAILQLVQRILTFLLNLGSYHQGIELQAKVRLRNRLAEWLLLYEPLGTLKGLLQQESDLLDDLQSTTDVYIQNLTRCNRLDLVEKAQRLLDYKHT